METKTIKIFDEGGYTVSQCLNKLPIATFAEWVISDGVHSFSVFEPPSLNIEDLKKEMQQYLQERRDSLDNEMKEIVE